MFGMWSFKSLLPHLGWIVMGLAISPSHMTQQIDRRLLFSLLCLPSIITRFSIFIRLCSTSWLCNTDIWFPRLQDQKVCSDMISKGHGAVSPHQPFSVLASSQANYWQHRWVEGPQSGIYGTFFALPNVGCKVAWEGLALLSTSGSICFLWRCQGLKTQQPHWEAKDAESPSPGYLDNRFVTRNQNRRYQHIPADQFWGFIIWNHTPWIFARNHGCFRTLSSTNKE